MNIDITQIQPIVDKIVELYRNELHNQGINASSTLSNSITSTIDVNDTKLVISFNLEPYWRYVEYGRRPGKMPPIDKISQWIRIKPVIPDPINGRIPDTRSLAFLIARKIGREGIPGRKPLTKVMYSDKVENLIEEIRSIVMTQLKQELMDELK